MGINEILEAIATYGIFPVILAVIIFLMVKLFKKQDEINKSQQDSNRRTEDRLSAMLEGLSSVSDNVRQYHTPEEEDGNRRVNALVHEQMQELRAVTNANRVSCFLYHNGGRDVTGRSFQKMSMTQEVVDYNTVPVMGMYQNVPRMMFPILVEKLADVGYYVIKDIEEIKGVDDTTYQSFSSHGAHTVFIQGIRMTDRAIIGFIAVEFSSTKCEDIAKTENKVMTRTLRISGILETKDDEEVQNDK